MTATGLLTRLLGQARAVRHRARMAARNLQPPRRTALHIPADRVVPAPGAFARFGAGSWIVPPARIQGAEGIEVGVGVIVLEDSGLDVDAASGARLVIGDGTRLAKGAEITCTVGVTIGASVSSSDFVAITDTWGPAEHTAGPPPPPGAPVVIEAGAYLGWGCAIGPGVRVGAGAFVGEGAVVLEDVAPHTVVYGNPARVVRHLDPVSREWVGDRFG